MYNKKSGKSVRFDTKRKNGGKPPQIRPSPKQNRSESQCSCIFQELMNRVKYAYMGAWVKSWYASGKSYCVSKITPVRSKNRRITVSVFPSTLQLTALLLKSFRLRLHCYTLELRLGLWNPIKKERQTLCNNDNCNSSIHYQPTSTSLRNNVPYFEYSQHTNTFRVTSKQHSCVQGPLRECLRARRF